MFNPKQALERLRRNKNEKKDNSMENNVQPLFPDNSQKSTDNNLQDRVSKLEEMITRLSQELSSSNETVSKLKRQNSNLETQVLKLEYENSQLKSQQIYSQLRRQGSSSKIPETIREETKQREKSYEKPKIRAQPLIFSQIQPQKPTFSYQVEQFVDQIRQEPLENILKRKQNEFRARKPEKKALGQNSQNSSVSKCLKQLATIQKNYQKCLTNKPVLVIKLDDADFQ